MWTTLNHPTLLHTPPRPMLESVWFCGSRLLDRTDINDAIENSVQPQICCFVRTDMHHFTCSIPQRPNPPLPPSPRRRAEHNFHSSSSVAEAPHQRSEQTSRFQNMQHLRALDECEAARLARHHGDGALDLPDALLRLVLHQVLREAGLAHPAGTLHQHHEGRRLVHLPLNHRSCTRAEYSCSLILPCGVDANFQTVNAPLRNCSRKGPLLCLWLRVPGVHTIILGFAR